MTRIMAPYLAKQAGFFSIFIYARCSTAVNVAIVLRIPVRDVTSRLMTSSYAHLTLCANG